MNAFPQRCRQRHAFTLVEVLVVIAIIGLLTALLLPALSAAKERGRRAKCQSNVRQFLLAVQLYAGDFREAVPSGKSENANEQDAHIPVISTETRSNLIAHGGDARPLECPGLTKPFDQRGGWHYPDYGYVIGYNYLGGHRDTPWPAFRGFAGWISPQKMTEAPTLVLVTDLNDWSPGYGKTFVPHGQAGPRLVEGETTDPDAAGMSSRDAGAAGGNVGWLDGSVRWKPIQTLQHYRGSRLWGGGGCFAAW